MGRGEGGIVIKDEIDRFLFLVLSFAIVSLFAFKWLSCFVGVSTGIVTHHAAYTLEAEQSLQSVDPKVAMAYWEYPMVSERGHQFLNRTSSRKFDMIE